jgi:hypothetical protein
MSTNVYNLGSKFPSTKNISLYIYCTDGFSDFALAGGGGGGGRKFNGDLSMGCVTPPNKLQQGSGGTVGNGRSPQGIFGLI